MKQLCRPAVYWALLWLVLFALLAMMVMAGNAAPFDAFLRDGLHQSATSGLTAAFTSITHLGSVLAVSVMTLAGIAAFWLAWQHGAARVLAWTMAGSTLLDNSLKCAFQRSRPEPFFGLEIPASFSFPSGHALFSTCLFGARDLSLPTSRTAGPRAWQAGSALQVWWQPSACRGSTSACTILPTWQASGWPGCSASPVFAVSCPAVSAS